MSRVPGEGEAQADPTTPCPIAPRARGSQAAAARAPLSRSLVHCGAAASDPPLPSADQKLPALAQIHTDCGQSGSACATAPGDGFADRVASGAPAKHRGANTHRRRPAKASPQQRGFVGHHRRRVHRLRSRRLAGEALRHRPARCVRTDSAAISSRRSPPSHPKQPDAHSCAGITIRTSTCAYYVLTGSGGSGQVATVEVKISGFDVVDGSGRIYVRSMPPLLPPPCIARRGGGWPDPVCELVAQVAHHSNRMRHPGQQRSQRLPSLSNASPCC